MDRLFLDANVLFSAAYRSDSGLDRLWKLSSAQLVTSEYAAEEARINLPDEAQRRRLSQRLATMEVLPAFPAGALPAGVDLPEKACPILLSALEARATHLLTGDKEHFGKYFGRDVGGLRILTPGDYLRSQRGVKRSKR